SVADYEAVLTTEQKRRYGEPFHLAAQLCWFGIRMWAERNQHSDPIPFVIEAGKESADKALEAVFDKLYVDPQARARYRLDTLTKGTKEQFLPLQAADIIANSTHEADTYRTGGREPSRWLDMVNELLRPIPYLHVLQNKDNLTEWMQKLEEHYG